MAGLLGGGGGAGAGKGYFPPPSKILGGPAPSPLFLRLWMDYLSNDSEMI